MRILFEDKIRALLLLGSLPDTWETLKFTICNSTPNGVVTWNLVKTKILNEETIRIAKKGSISSHSKVLVTESWGRNMSRGPRKSVAESRSKSRGINSEVVCYHCHEKGHKKWQCRKWKKEKGKKRTKLRNKVVIVIVMLATLLLQLMR